MSTPAPIFIQTSENPLFVEKQTSENPLFVEKQTSENPILVAENSSSLYIPGRVDAENSLETPTNGEVPSKPRLFKAEVPPNLKFAFEPLSEKLENIYTNVYSSINIFFNMADNSPEYEIGRAHV